MLNKLSELLQKQECSIISGRVQEGRMSNSVLRSIPALDVKSIFPKAKRIQVTASLVTIQGSSSEPTHFHTSHLVALIIDGDGTMRTDTGSLAVVRDDLVIIPRGTKHFFDPGPLGLVYIGLEISDKEIDYQKHLLGGHR